MRTVEGAIAQAVRRHLQAIFKERNAPAGENGEPERGMRLFEMPVPGAGHENVRADEQQDGPHGDYLPEVGVGQNTARADWFGAGGLRR